MSNKDNLDMDLLAEADERQRAEQAEASFKYERETRMAERAALYSIPSQQAQVTTTTPVEEEDEGFGFWASEVGSAVGGGVRDALQETVETGSDIIGLDKPAFTLPEVNANESGIGEGARSMVQLMAGFIPAIGVVGKAGTAARAASNALTKSKKADTILDGKGGDFVKYSAAGGLADGTVIDPHEERLANLFVDLEKLDPEADKSIMEWFAADPTDSKAEGRLKNVLEGLALGGAVDGIIKSFKILKGTYGKDAASKIKELKEKKHYLDDERAVPEHLQAKTIGGEETKTPNLAPKKERVGKDGKPLPPKKVNPIKATAVKSLAKAVGDGDDAGIAKVLDDQGINLNDVDDVEGVRAIVANIEQSIIDVHKKAKAGTKKVETFAMVKALARSSGLSPRKIKSINIDTEDLGARVMAQTAVNTIQFRDTMNLIKQAVDEPLPANIASANKALEVFLLINREIAGTKTNTARALNSYRLLKNDTDVLAAKRLTDLLEGAGGTEVNLKKFEMILMHEAQGAKAVKKTLLKSVPIRMHSATLEVLINGMLSGPQTHMINALSNFLVSTMSIVEKAGAAGIHSIGLGAKNNIGAGNEAVTAAAVQAKTMGMFRGVKNALGITAKGIQAAREAAKRTGSGDFKGAGDVLRENEEEFGGTFRAFAKGDSQIDPLGKHKTEMGQDDVNAITGEKAGLKPRLDDEGNTLWSLSRVVDGLGSLVRMPGRMLITADDLFKTVGYTGELAEQAYNQAIREGYDPSSGTKFAERMAAIEKDPPEFLRKQALKVAREGTFTNPLGDSGRNLTNVINSVPFARFVVPFIRTPVNILKYAGTRTPFLRLMAKSVQDDLAAGGARADLANSKMVLTSTMYMMAAVGAAEGNITGGGGGEKTKALREDGWQAYSVKVGGTWYSYDRLDPISIPLAIAASMMELGDNMSSRQRDERAAEAMVLTLKFAGDKVWFSGVIELLAAVSRGDKGSLDQFVGQYPNTLIPFSSLRRTIARTIDPDVKEMYTAMDKIRNTMPFMDEDTTKIDSFGEKRQHVERLGPDWLVPIQASERGNDPVKNELARLKINLPKIPRKIGRIKDSKGVQLDQEQYERFQILVGKEAQIDGLGLKDALARTMADEEFKNLHEDPNFEGSLKEDVIFNIRRAFIKRATYLLRQEYPSLNQALIDDRHNVQFGLTGKPLPKWLADSPKAQ